MFKISDSLVKLRTNTFEEDYIYFYVVTLSVSDFDKNNVKGKRV